MGRLTFYFTLLKYKYCISRYAIFRAILITVKDFVHLMSTNINHEHKVWSACDSTSISQSIFMLSTLHPSSSFPLPCFSTSQNKGGYFSKCLFKTVTHISNWTIRKIWRNKPDCCPCRYPIGSKVSYIWTAVSAISESNEHVKIIGIFTT